MTGIEFRAWRMSREWSQPMTASILGVTKRTIVTLEGAGSAEIPKVYALAVRGINASSDVYPIKRKPGRKRRRDVGDGEVIAEAVRKSLGL